MEGFPNQVKTHTLPLLPCTTKIQFNTHKN